jgi:hypothetical protein
MSGHASPPKAPPPAAAVPSGAAPNTGMLTRDMAARIYIELASKMPSPDKAESLVKLSFKLAEVFEKTEKQLFIDAQPKVAAFDENFFDELVGGKK